MKWIIDIDESTIINLKNKPNRTEVDCAVLEGKPLNNIIEELKPRFFEDKENNMEINEELLHPVPVKCYRCGKDIGHIKNAFTVSIKANDDYPDFISKIFINASFTLCRKCADNFSEWAKEK